MVSDQALHCLFTVCSITIRKKRRKIPPNTPKIGNGLFLLISIAKSFHLKWVKTLKHHSLKLQFPTECFDPQIAGKSPELAPSTIAIETLNINAIKMKMSMSTANQISPLKYTSYGKNCTLNSYFMHTKVAKPSKFTSHPCI